jgi:small subunit ribosomal protein S17
MVNELDQEVEKRTDTAQTRKRVVGTVVSDKMQKTVVVQVDRRVRHKLYKKYVLQSRKYKAHDENDTAKVGDVVTLVETRPLSKHKRWALQKIIRRPGVGTLTTAV